jgi:hypothetical protein
MDGPGGIVKTRQHWKVFLFSFEAVVHTIKVLVATQQAGSPKMVF